MTHTSDQLVHWISQCSLKDQDAFSLLYRATSPQIFGVLLGMLKNRAMAEDALQETFVKLWNNASAYNNNKGEPLTWMISIARYRALDLLRKHKTKNKYEDLFSVESEYLSSATHYDSAPTDNTKDLDRCLDRLQKHARQSIVMAYCEGYTHEELSLRLDAPIGTVKSWIRRSLKRLQECMYELSKT